MAVDRSCAWFKIGEVIVEWNATKVNLHLTEAPDPNSTEPANGSLAWVENLLLDSIELFTTMKVYEWSNATVERRLQN